MKITGVADNSPKHTKKILFTAFLSGCVFASSCDLKTANSSNKKELHQADNQKATNFKIQDTKKKTSKKPVF